MTFEEYKVKFSRFHTRYFYFKHGGAGLFTWANIWHAKYIVGLGFTWGAMNLEVTTLIIQFILKDLFKMFFTPQGIDCANNMRVIFIMTVVLLSYSKNLKDFEVFLWAHYVAEIASPFTMSMYSAAAPRVFSHSKMVIADATQNIVAGIFWHIPFIIDLFSLNEQNHEPYMCSLCVHMSTFKFFASTPFAIYNNIDSPFKNTRALVTLPWVLFDFPALILMLDGCRWDHSLTYGVDRTPNLYRVFAIAVAGAGHVWLCAMLPFMFYDCWNRSKRANQEIG